MSRPPRAFIDANVFVASWTLDILLTLADRGAFRPCWSEGVLEEAHEAARRVHGTGRGARYIAEVVKAYPYATVEVGKGDLADMELPAPGNLHVAAGALAGG